MDCAGYVWSKSKTKYAATIFLYLIVEDLSAGGFSRK